MPASDFSAAFKQKIFQLSPGGFEAAAMEAFHFQAEHNPVYKQYLQALKVPPEQVKNPSQIPFLPVEFFKSQRIITAEVVPEQVFESSTTTGQTPSRHFVADAGFYLQLTQVIFEQFYGNLKDYTVLALLPAYLERPGSSLVAMADFFIRQSGSGDSGFYLYNQAELLQKIKMLQRQNRQVLLLGVTFALLDLAENFAGTDLSRITVMETGGMKGRRREMVREEVHQILKEKLNIASVHSEYGMTELLSQAYSQGEGIFEPPVWMQAFFRDLNDPFSISRQRKSGGINLIDLANIDSCCFLETMDIGSPAGENKFTVLGRYDNSEVRGCNLLVA
jgi:phenylacetate-coenzyme A ligase PaaK-like adenylate-forming protein